MAASFYVIFFILLCPLSLEAIDLSSKYCPDVCTTNIKNKPPIDGIINLSSKCPQVLTTANIKNYNPPIDGSLLVVVPWKVGFEQFVSFNPDSCSFDGFSVQVFCEAVRRSPGFHFDFVLHGNGTASPPYDDMIDMVATGVVDVVVADLTITSERMEKVRFSMPVLSSSLVMVTPLRHDHGALWDFMKPFSMPLWITLLGCFVATSMALYLLENQNPDFVTTTLPCKKHPHADSSSHGASPSTNNIYLPSSSLQRPGPPIYDASHKHRIINAFWFTSLCTFGTQQESVRSHLGRFVTVMWLFVMLVFNASYTANLATLLSAQKSYPTIEGFQALLHDSNISVGYQEGSFMTNYMEKIQINANRLKNFSTEKDYAHALKEGNLKAAGVGAVLDELPYIQILLQSECNLIENSDDNSLPSFGGFGFAFHKKSSKIEEVVSKKIIEMEEDGKLQTLKKHCGIGGGEDKSNKCNSSDETSQLKLKSFGGLFSMLVGVYVSCILINLLAKAIKSKEGSCSPIINYFACAQMGCNPTPGGVLSGRSNKVSDVSQEHAT